MTQWVERPAGGRERGPLAVIRAWIEVVIRPRRFFHVGVAPGDQAPGLVFVAAVVLVEETIRLALVADARPVFAGQPLASALLWIAVAVVFLAPAGLHFVAALATVVLAGLTRLVGLAPDRGGVGETVQVVAYATAPCVLAGVPVPAVRVVCAAYGCLLLVAGMATVHDLSWPRAVVAALVPAALVFGYGFRGFDALAAVGIV